ncbi:MAG TPA: peptidylprolyl isomerase [Candidatus Binatia bacterium]
MRSPLVRLLVLGTLLLAAERVLALHGSGAAPSRPTVRVPASQVDAAVRAFVAATGRAPDERERAALIAAAVDEEILYREALARGLAEHDPVVQQRLVSNMAFVDAEGEVAADTARRHRDALALGMATSDVVVRRRLIDRMRALLEEPAFADAPTDDELAATLAAEPERFLRPERVRISQVMVRRDARDPSDLARDAAHAQQRADRDVHGAPDARAVAQRLLAAGLPDPSREPDALARVGDASPLPAHLPLQGEHDLARLFGASFARDVLALPVGRWSGPISSPYGEHLVWVHERAPTEPLPLDAVRGELTELVRSRRAQAALERALAELRARWDVVVEGADTERAG